MGKELSCTMQYLGKSHAGRLYLETDYLLFRGDVRLKIVFGESTSVTTTAGLLRVCAANAEADFELGKDAAKWADKILHPPTRTAKLGIRPDMKVSLVGNLDADFVADLEQAGARVVRSGAELIFLAVETTEQLKKVATLGSQLASKKALWIVYPKGVSVIRETDVIGAGRLAGLKDTKVTAFSKTHTALRFSRAEPQVLQVGVKLKV